ncbi:MAG: N-6 DNA methylase, partial [Victivallales bacterium]|nr:N-6 DNA methylase [Victivallales bacterium]
MDRISIVEKIGKKHQKINIENGEWSYAKDAGSLKALESTLGKKPTHYKLDLRFENNGVVVLVETKQKFKKDDETQLSEYLDEEQALHPSGKIIAMLANTNDDRIKVWQGAVDDEHVLASETVAESMAHYESLFAVGTKNDREQVMKNTYDLNELLHKMDIDPAKRSQFVGTTLLYIKAMVRKVGGACIDEALVKKLNNIWTAMDDKTIRAGIASVLEDLLDGSENKDKKIELLKRNVLDDQKVRRLTTANWIKILDTILTDIYRYINADSSEGQDILNLFFIAFNKFTGKADRNQAFTPDHITDFMCRVADVDREKVVMDITCGSGSLLVQAMVKALADCRRGKSSDEAQRLMSEVKKKHIFGIEIEEKAYGLATTNMLIHGDGNSNIKFDDCFKCKNFIIEASPDVILMNPPYNAKPIGIPAEYKKAWGKATDGKEDPTKGLVFIHFLSDVVEIMNVCREKKGLPRKTVKLAVLLPVSTAIGSKEIIRDENMGLLERNTLEAVFTLPNEIFYPGASASACCMVFTLGKPHLHADGTVSKTFFGYYKEDGFKKKKNLGRVEQFDENNQSKWREIEKRWISMFRNKEVVVGLSAMADVTGEDEWLCEAYMETDYSTLCEADFQRPINNYFAYRVANGYPVEISYRDSRAHMLQIGMWKEFRLEAILSILNGKGITKEEIDDNPGDFIAVQSGEENNGVLGKIDKDYCIEKEYTYTEKPCLTVARSGSAGFVSFQSEGCVVGDSAKILLLPDDIASTPVYLFIQTILTANRFKYAYGRKVTEDKYKNEILALPIQRNPDGSPVIDATRRFSAEGFVPSWRFMEEYMKSLPYG